MSLISRGAAPSRGDAAQTASPPNGRLEPEANAAQVDDGGVPVRADGVELIGEISGSGYREPPALVRRSDGQTLQLTKLLYLVIEAIDGLRTYDEIADAVSTAFGRPVSADDVRMLCDSKLRTLGVLQLADGSQPAVKRSDPLLGLKFRYVVSDPSATTRITAPFARLFNPFVMAAVLAAFVAVCAWVFLEKGLASATHQVFDEPGLLMVVFALTLVSAGFHEFGHAAAARRGGATPGAMGVGLYLVWPAFYTDVTDSYRLGRGGRLRTDLGGLYFNAIVAVAMFAAWWVSGWDALLLIIAAQVLQMLRHLVPLVRFDGYHVLADVSGIPDLYHRIKPTLLGLLPSRWGDPESKVLKPWARAVITTWVLVVVPLLLAVLVLMTLTLPRLLGTARAGLDRQWQLMVEQLATGDVLAVMVRLLSIVAIALPVLGVGYILARVVRQVVSGTWQATKGRHGRRAVAGGVAAAIIAGLVLAWWPQPGAYRPIQPYERGTLQDAFGWAETGIQEGRSGTAETGIQEGRSATAETGIQEGRSATAQTIWPEASELPTADSPALALVLVPRTAGDSAPTWVFPFNRPAAPEAGDNQALAVNTEDGSTVYDVAFVLVWAIEDTVLNTNEAYAFASCTDCRTVAVAFQVVLVLGREQVVVPTNLSGAVNYSCVECVTYALATQLLVTLSGPLSVQSDADLAALWEDIAAFGESIEGVPLSELQSSLAEFERLILDIIRADPSAAPSGETNAPVSEPSASPTGAGSSSTTGTAPPSASPSASPTASPTATPTATPSPAPTAS